jgi:putative transposase
MGMKIHKGYKYRLRTNRTIAHQFVRFAGACRFVWNKILAINEGRYLAGVPRLTYADSTRLLTLWKQSEEYGWLTTVHSQVLQQCLKDLDRAYTNLYEGRAQPPTYRKKFLADAFRYPQGFEVNGNHVYVPKIEWGRFWQSRPIDGSIKNITVLPPLNALRTHEHKLVRAQQALAQKVKFSQNWQKQQARIRRIHTKIANCRYDFLHKHSTEISKNHAVVIVEDLQVRNMSRLARGTPEAPGRNVKAKSGLNKAILDQGWGMFRCLLTYKQAWRGGKVIAVPPRYTSQQCPVWVHIDAKNRVQQALFSCQACALAYARVTTRMWWPPAIASLSGRERG